VGAVDAAAVLLIPWPRSLQAGILNMRLAVCSPLKLLPRSETRPRVAGKRRRLRRNSGGGDLQTARWQKAKAVYKLGSFKLSSRLLVGALVSATLVTMGFMVWVNLSPLPY
jgi:hypothetical protein